MDCDCPDEWTSGAQPCDCYEPRGSVIVTHCREPLRCLCGHERRCHASEADAIAEGR